MGFDKHFNQDHCYLDDPADSVAMNVEIMEENYQIPQNNAILGKPVIRYLDISGSSNSRMIVSSEDTNKYSKKALVYLPYSEYCSDHKGLFLHKDEKLVKPGDKFASHDDFVQYLNENAKRWCFYYRCSDSRKPNTGYETYTYNCVYLRNKEKYKKKGLRKRNNNMKTDCPCKIKLRHLPNEKELTVVYVCNHHDHELSLQEFYKLQHGRRLPPYVKEEIKDFLQLKVDIMKIRAYVEMETGFTMSRPFFYALEKNLKSREVERHISEQRLMLLKQKIAAVDEMYGNNEEENGDEQEAEQMQDHADDDHVTEATKKIKHRRTIQPAERARSNKTPPLKRRSKPNEVVTSSEDSKRIKIKKEHTENNYTNETLQSVKHLQESVKCEIQRNPWIADQCVPLLPNRTAKNPEPSEETVHIQTVEHLDEDIRLMAQNAIENLSYTIEYCNDDNQEIISNELVEIINEGKATDVAEENDIDNIAYETVVTDDIDETQNVVQEYTDQDETLEEALEYQIISQDDVNDHSEILNDFDNTEDTVEEENHVEYKTKVTGVTGDIDETQNVVQEYIDQDETLEEALEYQIISQEDVNDHSEILNDFDNTEDTVEEENHVEYTTEVTGVTNDVVEYVDDEVNEGSAQDVAVQTGDDANGNASTAHSLLPVFDVYMKDGNVTGFVVSDNLISGLKDGVDKEIQTSEDVTASDTQELGNEDFDGEIIHNISNSKSGDTYTKHEYVHKYNIDKYMTQPHFPKYVETLAKETYMDVLHMFTNIYNEKAMFKITTTQRGKEGNTRIWYVKDGHRSKRRRKDETQREKLGQNLQSIFILKEKLRYMKKKNSELLSKNKQLEEVALRLVEMTEET